METEEPFFGGLRGLPIDSVPTIVLPLKTGKVKATRNPGGLLLVRLGLVAPKTSIMAR